MRYANSTIYFVRFDIFIIIIKYNYIFYIIMSYFVKTGKMKKKKKKNLIHLLV